MLTAYQEYDSLISLWDLMEHTSLGSDISQQPQVLAPLNLTPDLVHPKSWLFLLHVKLAWFWTQPSELTLKDIGPHSLSPFLAMAKRRAFAPRGKDWCGFAELCRSCWILLWGKGEGGNLLPSYFLLSIAKVDLPLFSTCHVSSSSFPLPGSGDHCWQLAKPSVFCWWCISNRLD